MGLMLSVLVFCVGVIEALDCWHHFLWHVVHPQYNPLPHSLVAKTTTLWNKRYHAHSTFKQNSKVDICWPEDLSPKDDIHILKKRPNEHDRNHEHNGDFLRRHSMGKPHHNDKDFCSEDKPNNSQISVHIPSFDDFNEEDRLIECRKFSQTLLELDVIAESDSSTDIDEPSQIQNVSSNKGKQPEPTCSKSEVNEESADVLQELSSIVEVKDSSAMQPDNHFTNNSILRPTCPSSLLLQKPKENGSSMESHCSEKIYQTEENQTHSSKLPLFTDNILSHNVTKVSFSYPNGCNVTKESTLRIDKEDRTSPDHRFNDKNSCTERGDQDPVDVDLKHSCNIDGSSLAGNVLQTIPLELQVTPNLFNEERVPNQDLPEIQILSGSPLLEEESSESVNTSEVSCFIRSRTSDRPLKIRFSPPVTKPNPWAVKCTERESQNEEIHEKDVFYDAQELPHGQLDSQQSGSLYMSQSRTQVVEGNTLHSSNDRELVNEFVVETQKVCDTNSSSSSLSGIPQLPEDTKDVIYTFLPTDNGFGSDEFDSLEKSESDKIIFEPSSPSENSESAEEFKVHDALERTSGVELYGDREINKNISALKDLPSGIEPVKQETNVSVTSKKADASDLPSPENTRESIILDSDKNKKIGECLTLKDTTQQEKDEINNLLSHSKVPDKPERRSSSKCSPPATPSDTKNIVVMCQAKESDEENNSGLPAENGIVISGSSLNRTSNQNSPGTSSKPEAVASTSKNEHPEDKAFWLIFSGEYTKAMNKDWHSGHFCCWQCDESLTGQRYVLRDDHPYCIKCYESVFANGCEECNKTIGIDSKDLSYKDKHWHEACFLCNKCRVSLVDKQFGSKSDKIFCGNCYDAQFASRCDGCGQIFKAGTKKMEYKTRQWHEPCFACCVCKSPIGTKSFIPREQEIYCATCYEEKFATRCVKCNKIITSGGVTYKNEPWHRECFTCTNCNTSLAGQRFTSREEKPYCADCFGELFAKRCTACCKPITGIGGTRFVSFEDRHWHNDCFVCAACKTSLVGRGFITDGDDIICPECAKQKLM